MKLTNFFLAGIISLILLSDASGQTTKPPEGFESIFNGHDFTGWSGPMESFRIQDGAIVGGTLEKPIPQNQFLTAEKSYTNFVLRLKFKLVGDNVNAGIQIRSQRIPNHHEMIGYQADLGQKYWGALYDESRRRRMLDQPNLENVLSVIKLNDWNDYTIRANGNRVRLSINGFETVDYTEKDASLEQFGLIGLQIHSGPPSEAWYKDIWIRELP